MSRFSGGASYDHRVRREFFGEYEISWSIDVYYPDSRQRFPRRIRRHTDEAGARRFCKKWGLAFPEPKEG